MDGLAPGPDGPAGTEGVAPAGGEPAGADEAVEWDVVPEQSEDVVPEQSEEAASEESGAPAGHGVIRRRRLVAAAIVVLLVVIGVLVWRLTDTGGGPSPKLGGTPAEVVTLVNGLQRALAGGDYQTICDSLFTTAARLRQKRVSIHAYWIRGSMNAYMMSTKRLIMMIAVVPKTVMPSVVGRSKVLRL